jgi:hypothetical protein
MSFDEARRVDIHVHVWDEGEQPVISEFTGTFTWERLSAIMEEKLATKEYGAIIRTYDDREQIGLYYRAFTDPHRGRIVVAGASQEDVNDTFESRKEECALKVFTPAELYALKPVSTEFDCYTVIQYIDAFDSYNLNCSRVDAELRLEVRRLAYENEWMLAAVWFDNKPVMVINYSGKDGENKDKWITDADLYAEMVMWLHTFESKTEITGFVKASCVIPALTEFGSHTLHDFYDIQRQESKK